MNRREVTVRRRWNRRYDAALIVGAINYSADGSLFDWAAYGGAGPAEMAEDVLAIVVARQGDKLERSDAAHFFPELPPERWRP